MMDSRNIIMNYTLAPSLQDMEEIAMAVLETLPDELTRFCENLVITIEDMVDEVTEEELDLDDPFELLALFKSGKEIAPGIERKVANDDDVLFLFRRAILDIWCESGDDLSCIMRQVMVEELGRNFEFSEDEIAEMGERHYQGLL